MSGREAALRAGTENSKGVRLDIQGLRALAVLLVLLCHAEVPFLEGGFIGVDVFFVISGFLITGLLDREIKRTGSVSFLSFYGRRARRLLPLATLVLVFVAIGSLVLFPLLRQIETGWDIVGAAFYFVNWIFAAQDVNYFTVDDLAVSPVQHYWSLSVEEQFYLVWPLVMVCMTLLASKLKARVDISLVVALTTIAVLSLGYSIYFTDANPDAAYFSTLTRMWELALGGLLALSLPRAIAISARISDALVVTGLALVVGSAVLITDQTPFPGWQALPAVVGTLLLLVGGASIERGQAVRIFLWRPIRHTGDISYSWYLWHWPFIVFALVIWPEIGTVGLLAVVAFSLIPTELSHRGIERPIHHSRKLGKAPKRALAIGAACSVAAASIGFVVGIDRFSESGAVDAEGAAVIGDGPVPLQRSAEQVTPPPLEANADTGQAFEDGCLAFRDVAVSPPCVYGDPESSTGVVLLGDSRAIQWFAALEEIAQKNAWRLTVLTRGDCPPVDISLTPACDGWKADALSRIVQQEKPDLVVAATGTKYIGPLGGRGRLPEISQSFADTLGQASIGGAKVAVIRGQSRTPFVVAECVAEHMDSLRRCAFPPSDRRDVVDFDRQGALLAGAKLIDPEPYVCRPLLCPAVIGNVLVYKDRYHYSSTFVETLAPWLEGQLPKIR